MLRKLFLLFTLSFFAVKLSAQSTISGIIKDTSSHSNVKNAVVTLLTPKDSVLKAFTRVKEDGSWSLNAAPGNYILSVTHPVYGEFIDDISIKEGDQKLPLIALTPKAKLLEAVLVQSNNGIRLKGDTTVFTADSFKVSANANVEELLKKMPGIQVDKDGKIKAMGQAVEKVLVDGEEFFGDDPGMAVKNLRADAVKEVQVFDKKSEQSEFTGIDDGKTQKTINLKLKENKKTGYFGKVDLSGGIPDRSHNKPDIDDRYNENILLSSFKGKRKLSGFLLTGNTGQDGLNWQDEQKYGGDNDNFSMSMDDDDMSMFMWRGNTSDEEPYLDPQNGYITNVNAGVQYSNKYNDGKTSINFAPKYNSQRYNNHKSTFTQTQLGDSVLNENSDGNVFIDRYNIKLRGIYDVKIDSVNTLKVTANANFNHTESTESRNAVTTGQFGTLKNASNRIVRINSDKDALSGNAIFKHKFKKNRRTLSFTADWNSVNTDGLNFLRSENTDYFLNYTQLTDQMKDYNKNTSNVSGKFIYTEPLNKKYALELGYQLALNYGTNDQTTYAHSPSGKYEDVVDSLTNQFRQNILQHIPSAKINYSYKKLKANFGAGVSLTNFMLKDITYNKLYDRNYSNFYPTANLNYTWKPNHNLRLNYSGVTRQPTIDQLQPLRNNNDQFNQYIGNPDLKPSFSNNFSLSGNGYNFLKDLYWYQSLNLSLVNNSITNNRVIDPNNAKTITQPVNTNGNFSLNYYGGTGFKFKKINTRLNINGNGGFNHYADVINSKKSFSNNTNAGVSFGLSKSKDKKYDVSIGNEIEYNVQNTSQNNNSIHYFTNTFNVNATLYYKKVWSLNTESNFYSRQKTSQVPSISNNMVNLKLQRTFKKDEFTFYAAVHDLLNDNIGVDRNFYSNTFTETRNDRLQRYYMVGFAWNFKNKAKK